MTRVIVSAQGQADNVGDSVLRRGLLDALRTVAPLVVNVTGCPEGYVRGLRLDSADTVVRSRDDWRRTLGRIPWNRDAFAYNAGEELLAARWAASYLRIAPLLALARLRGAGAVHTGFGLRADHPVWSWAFRAGLAPCRIVTWRDQASRDWAGFGTVEPDWAYAAGPAAPGGVAALPTPGRNLLAVALRGDRPAPDAAWVDAVRTFARDRSLHVVVVVQVARDDSRAAEVAAMLHGDLLPWAGPAHDTVEAAVREVYRSAELVVSDRLHAAIIGHTEGAVPVGLSPSGSTGTAKLGRTLAAVGLRDAAFAVGDDVTRAVEHLHCLVGRRAEILACADDAARRLGVLADALAAALMPR